MSAMTLNAPISLDTITLVNKPEPTAGSGEILVRVHASSLNYHDYLVATGVPASFRRIDPHV